MIPSTQIGEMGITLEWGEMSDGGAFGGGGGGGGAFSPPSAPLHVSAAISAI